MTSSVLYPLNLDISGRLCVVVGGGGVALRKVRGLLEAGARVRVVGPDCLPELHVLAARGAVELLPRPYQDGDLAGAMLAFAATNDPAVQDQVRAEARERDIPVNVADAPSHCTFQVPAAHRSGPLLLTVSTGGASPALAARIRRELAGLYGPEYGELLGLLSQARDRLLARGGTQEERRILFQKLLDRDILDLLRQGRRDQARERLEEVLAASSDAPETPGEIP